MARPRPAIVRLTEAAGARVRQIMAERGAGLLRVGVKNGGCAGMEYVMDYIAAADAFDEVIEDQGVRIAIEAKAVLFLLGTEIDFETTKLAAKFQFNNPNQTDACGCGESVAITPAAGSFS